MLGSDRKYAVAIVVCSTVVWGALVRPLARAVAATVGPGTGEELAAAAESSSSNRPARPAIKPHYLGAVPDPSARSTSGARIQEVQPGSPAAQAGLRPGDVITAIGSARIRGLTDLDTALRTAMPGQPVDLVYERDGKEARTTVTLIGRR